MSPDTGPYADEPRYRPGDPRYRADAEARDDLHRTRAELAALIRRSRPGAEPRADDGEFPRSWLMRQIVQHKLPAGAIAAGAVLLAVKPRLAMRLLRTAPVAALASRALNPGGQRRGFF